jgi:hypothetical protein
MAHSRYKSSLADIGFSVCQSGTHSSAPIHWSTNAKSMHSLTCVEAINVDQDWGFFSLEEGHSEIVERQQASPRTCLRKVGFKRQKKARK